MTMTMTVKEREDGARHAGRRAAPWPGGRWTAVSGCVYVAAWVAGLLVAPSGPAVTAPASEVAAYYRAHGDAALLQTYLLDGVAGVALLVFAAAMHSALRRPEGAGAPLATILVGGGIAAASVSLVQAALGTALCQQVAGRSAEMTQLLFTLFNDADTFKMGGLALLVAAGATLAVRTRALPRWLGWVGAVLALALIVGGWSFVLGNAGLYTVLSVALPLLLVWVAAISVVSWRRAA